MLEAKHNAGKLLKGSEERASSMNTPSPGFPVLTVIQCLGLGTAVELSTLLPPLGLLLRRLQGFSPGGPRGSGPGALSDSRSEPGGGQGPSHTKGPEESGARTSAFRPVRGFSAGSQQD